MKGKPMRSLEAEGGGPWDEGAANGGRLEVEGSVPGRISLLYESRDGGICVFEDAEGHLTSVRASRLV